ncbi:hypothetical protein TWF694_002401 [Orbilia ellipsospora]|uniref:DUF7719 domain-containing protein n=1 Tax=Orbilia ellipsospora TaxID=2528407 RepID=A0AAV9X349_9PEZI
MPRQRKSHKAKPAQVDSDSEIEEIPRKNLFEGIESNFPNITSGVPFSVEQLRAPLAEALSKDTKKEKGITYESYNIPTALPKRNKPSKKKKDDDAKKSDEESEEGEGDDVPVIGDAGQTFFFAIPLTMMLFGFYVMVKKQYVEEPDHWDGFLRSLKSFPAIWMVLYLTHPRKDWMIVQLLFFATAVGTGCWIVYNVNINGYYAIMKMVPPLGVMLVYSVIQMDLLPSTLSLAAIVGYIWYNDFGFFQA